MVSPLSRNLSTALLMTLSAFNAHAARGVLHADGLLRIKGAELVGSRITVMPKDAPSYLLVHDAARFLLELDLDNSYLVSFEQHGCVTKMLYFDTRVSADQQANNFTFPFQVTLEKPETAFTYAGPVGFILYKPNLTDFGYETDYAVNLDGSLATRMETLTRTGIDPFVAALPARVASVVTRGYQRPGEAAAPSTTLSFGDRTAPNTNEVPVMVQRTSSPAEKVLPVTTPIADKVKEEAILSKPVALAMVPFNGSLLEPASLATSTVNNSDRSMRDEELIVAPRSVTTIVHIHHDQGPTDEYRKVAYAYGATFYFMNDVSVTQRAFASGTGSGR